MSNTGNSSNHQTIPAVSIKMAYTVVNIKATAARLAAIF
jgi:hypothetical protein